MTLRRVFIGLPLEPGDARALRRLLPAVDRSAIRIVPWHNYHLTLAFLGALSRDQLKGLETGLAAMADFLPLALRIDTVAPFPNKAAGLLAALVCPDKDLRALYDAAQNLAQTVIDKREPPPRFRPHITLARTRKRTRNPVFSRQPVTLAFTLQRLGLYEGAETAAGYRYQALCSIERSAGSSS